MSPPVDGENVKMFAPFAKKEYPSGTVKFPNSLSSNKVPGNTKSAEGDRGIDPPAL